MNLSWAEGFLQLLIIVFLPCFGSKVVLSASCTCRTHERLVQESDVRRRACTELRPIDREYPWQRRRKGAAVLNWARQRHRNVNGGLNHDRSRSATSKKLFSAKWSSTVEERRPRRWNFHQTWTSDLPQAVDRWPRNSHRAGIRKICFAVDLVDVNVARGGPNLANFAQFDMFPQQDRLSQRDYWRCRQMSKKKFGLSFVPCGSFIF